MDVPQAAANADTASASPPSSRGEAPVESAGDLGADGHVVRRLDRTRRVIAKRLGEAWRDCVPVTLHAELPVSGAEQRAAELGVSFYDLVVDAVIQTLAEQPRFNATFDGDAVTEYQSVNLAVAVDTRRGLVAPVLQRADLHGAVGEQRAARKELTRRALEGELKFADLSGATFTLSNLGTLGISHFTPIINPPQVAILGTGVVRRDADGIPQLYVSFTFDHRVNDGADAARFLALFRRKLSATSK
jgi:pyruvate dehydrogenase E2 component (dihydrolipoamide acetyltransferase)